MKQQRSEDGPSGAQKANCDLWDEENDLPSPPKKGSYFFQGRTSSKGRINNQ